MISDDFTHFDKHGRAVMVDVSGKAVTHRIAKAKAEVIADPRTISLIRFGGVKKGDVLSIAQAAGIMAAKKTPDLIPLAHPLPLQAVEIGYKLEESRILITSRVKCEGRTGAEMEALTAVSVCALTIYDMCKAVQRDIEIGGIRLVGKTGGESGDYGEID